MFHLKLILSAFIAYLMFTNAAWGQQRYYLIELGNSGNQTPYDVNDRGEAVGTRNPVPLQATLWKDGLANDLGAIIGTYFSSAQGINDSGTIVGDTGSSGAFLIQNGNVTLFNNVNAGVAINGLDQWIGESTTQNNTILHWDPNDGFTQMVVPSPSFYTIASGINDMGFVIANGFYATQVQPAPRGGVFERSGVGTWTHQILPLEPSHGYSFVNDINNYGIVVGSSYWYIGAFFFGHQSCLWQKINGQWEIRLLDLLPGGLYGSANAVNNQNQIVGWSNSANGTVATLWENGVPYDLNPLVFMPPSWSSLIKAFAISDAGYIVGEGVKTGGTITGFLLEPMVPVFLCE